MQDNDYQDIKNRLNLALARIEQEEQATMREIAEAGKQEKSRHN